MRIEEDETKNRPLTVEGVLKISKIHHPGRNIDFSVCTIELDRPLCFIDASGNPDYIDSDLDSVNSLGVGDSCNFEYQGRRIRVVGTPALPVRNIYNPFMVGLKKGEMELVRR